MQRSKPCRRFSAALLLAAALGITPHLASAQAVRASFMSPLTFALLQGDENAFTLFASYTYFAEASGGGYFITNDVRHRERLSPSFAIQSLPDKTLTGGLSRDGSRSAGTVRGSSSGPPQAAREQLTDGSRQLFELGTVGLGISGDGSTVVGYGTGRGAMRWGQDGTGESLGELPGAVNSQATAASFNGNAIAGFLGNRAFRWTAATGMVALPAPNEVDRFFGAAISDDGSRVVITRRAPDSPPPEDAFFYSAGTWLWTAEGGLQSLGDDFVFGGMKADGSVIYGTRGSGASLEPVRWTATTGTVPFARTLTAQLGSAAAGWTFLTVRAVSADGNLLLGEGVLRGYRLAWLARLKGLLPPTRPSLQWSCSDRDRLRYARPTTITVTVRAYNATRVTLTNGRFRRVHRPTLRPWRVRVPLHRGTNVIRMTVQGPGGQTPASFTRYVLAR